MRLAPVPMRYTTAYPPRGNRAQRRKLQAQPTEQREAVDACRYFAGLLVGALNGVDKETLLSPRYCPGGEPLGDPCPLARKVDEIAAGSFKRKEPPEIRGTGYVVDTLEAVLWAFHRTDNFPRGRSEGGKPR